MRSAPPQDALADSDSGAIHRAAQGAERLARSGDGAGYLFRARDIGRGEDRPRADFPGEAGARFFVQVYDRDVRAGCRQCARARGAEPGSAAGDQKRVALDLRMKPGSGL
jgi:hypothetical protein